jgi:ABC-type nitrate/sulfonate/bicarbonate transport system substrate-binding protein
MNSFSSSQRRRLLRGLASGSLPVLIGPVATMRARAQGLARLRLNTFPNATNLALYYGQAHGLFEREGIDLDLQFTPNSEAQRDGLAQGRFEIAYSAVDNAVAMVELAREDVVIVSGGDSSMNEFMVRPEIERLTDLRGRTLVVDRPETAYALQAKKILRDAGLLPGRDYQLRAIGATMPRIEAMLADPANAMAMLNPPFTFVARERGLKSLGRFTDLVGPYQGGGLFVMRRWAEANAGLLERFLAAYIESTRQALAPANRDEAVRLISTRLRQTPAVAARTLEVLLDPRAGLAADARLDVPGLARVLALRAEVEGQWGGTAPAASRYYDNGPFERALARLGARSGSESR